MIEAVCDMLEGTLVRPVDSAAIARGIVPVAQFLGLPRKVSSLLGLTLALLLGRAEAVDAVAGEVATAATSAAAAVGAVAATVRTELHAALVEFCQAFDLDPALVQGIVAISSRDFAGIVKLARRFGSGQEAAVEEFVRVLENIQVTLAFVSFADRLRRL